MSGLEVVMVYQPQAKERNSSCGGAFRCATMEKLTAQMNQEVITRVIKTAVQLTSLSIELRSRKMVKAPLHRQQRIDFAGLYLYGIRKRLFSPKNHISCSIDGKCWRMWHETSGSNLQSDTGWQTPLYDLEKNLRIFCRCTYYCE